jgi:hypothetical protein
LNQRTESSSPTIPKMVETILICSIMTSDRMSKITGELVNLCTGGTVLRMHYDYNCDLRMSESFDLQNTCPVSEVQHHVQMNQFQWFIDRLNPKMEGSSS